ncbi:MAG: hypothetical protein AB1521_04630 [Bacteroidota bacterium]
MSITKLIITIVLVTLFVIGCDNTIEPVPPVEYDTLIPLNIGNYWLYQGYYLNRDDGTIDFPEYNKFGFIIHSLPTYLNNSIVSENLQMSICGEDLTPIDDSNILLYGGSKLVYHNNKGVYYTGIIRKDSLVMVFNDLIFPYPVEKGESATGHVFYYSPLGNGSNVPDDVITEYTCISTDSLFATPIGDFRCIVFRMSYVDFEPLFRGEVYYFIRPNLGIVGTIEMVYHYGQNKYSYLKKYVLTEYKINQGE